MSAGAARRRAGGQFSFPPGNAETGFCVKDLWGFGVWFWAVGRRRTASQTYGFMSLPGK